MAKKYNLTSDVLTSLSKRFGTEIVVEGENLEQLIDLQNKMDRLKVMGQDENRCFFTEIPRPTPEEWGDCDNEIDAGNFENKEEYLKEWVICNPRETSWIEVSSVRFQDNRNISIRFESSNYISVSNSSHFLNQEDMKDSVYQWFVDMLLPYLSELVDCMLQNIDSFNDYVEQKLPYQLREGRISRKLLNQIVPAEKVCVQDVSTAMQALSICNQEVVAHPLKTMSIRIYCKYYRLAHEMFYGKSVLLDKLDDIAYYEKVKLNFLDNIYNVDSVDDFKKFAVDHYGELGLSRLNVLASADRGDGWKFIVSNCYSVYVGKTIDVATVLYKSKVPLYIHDVNKLLEVISEEGNVRLVQSSYHNYMNDQEEATVFRLPWMEECGKDTDCGLTIEQCYKIIESAQWNEITKVSLA